MSARMNPGRQLALGALIFSTLSLLAYYTLFLTESSLFGDKEQITITFDEARGLRTGDAVLVAGVRWGRVADVKYDSNAEIDRRITVKATLTQPVELREDGWFRIEDSTLLGGRVLSINPGTPGMAMLEAPYHGEVVISPLDAMGTLISENSDDFKKALKSLSTVGNLVTDGEGLISDLLKSQALADDFAGTLASAHDTFDNIDAMTTKALDGKGTIGLLLDSDELYKSLEMSFETLKTILDDGHEITEGLNNGEGTLGALIKDKDLEEQVRGIVADLTETTSRIKAGKGTLGALINDKEIYNNVLTLTTDLAVVSAELSAGEGTLGRLLMTKDLYVQIERALGMITSSLEEYREAAPITSMTSVLFNAF